MSLVNFTKRSLEETEPSFDGLVPRREHRSFQPWQNFDLGPKERASQARLYPVQQLVAAMATDDFACERVAAIKLGDETAESVARFYVWRAGYSRTVMEEVFERAGRFRSDDPRASLLSLGVAGVDPDAPLDEGDPTQWSHNKNFKLAGAMLVMVGARRCPTITVRRPGSVDSKGRRADDGGIDLCGVNIRKSSGKRVRYCSVHSAVSDAQARNDREAMTNLLTAVGRSLRVT